MAVPDNQPGKFAPDNPTVEPKPAVPPTPNVDAMILKNRTNGLRRRRIRKIAVIAALIALAIATLSILYGPHLVWRYYLVFRGGDLASIYAHRHDALEDIWSKLVRFKEENGRWPRTRLEFKNSTGSMIIS